MVTVANSQSNEVGLLETPHALQVLRKLEVGEVVRVLEGPEIDKDSARLLREIARPVLQDCQNDAYPSLERDPESK